jgi:hypothetical protein
VPYGPAGEKRFYSRFAIASQNYNHNDANDDSDIKSDLILSYKYTPSIVGVGVRSTELDSNLNTGLNQSNKTLSHIKDILIEQKPICEAPCVRSLRISPCAPHTLNGVLRSM